MPNSIKPSSTMTARNEFLADVPDYYGTQVRKPYQHTRAENHAQRFNQVEPPATREFKRGDVQFKRQVGSGTCAYSRELPFAGRLPTSARPMTVSQSS